MRNKFTIKTNHGPDTKLKHDAQLTLEVPAGWLTLEAIFGMNRHNRQSFAVEAGQTYYFIATTEARVWSYRPVLIETTEAGFQRQIAD